MADLPSYIEASRKAAKDFQEPPTWASKAILNVARVGRFSSDRTIQEYARDIWGIRSAVFPPEPGSPMATEPLSAEVSR